MFGVEREITNFPKGSSPFDTKKLLEDFRGVCKKVKRIRVESSSKPEDFDKKRAWAIKKVLVPYFAESFEKEKAFIKKDEEDSDHEDLYKGQVADITPNFVNHITKRVIGSALGKGEVPKLSPLFEGRRGVSEGDIKRYLEEKEKGLLSNQDMFDEQGRPLDMDKYLNERDPFYDEGVFDKTGRRLSSSEFLTKKNYNENTEEIEGTVSLEVDRFLKKIKRGSFLIDEGLKNKDWGDVFQGVIKLMKGSFLDLNLRDLLNDKWALDSSLITKLTKEDFEDKEDHYSSIEIDDLKKEDKKDKEIKEEEGINIFKKDLEDDFGNIMDLVVTGKQIIDEGIEDWDLKRIKEGTINFAKSHNIIVEGSDSWVSDSFEYKLRQAIYHSKEDYNEGDVFKVLLKDYLDSERYKLLKEEG